MDNKKIILTNGGSIYEEVFRPMKLFVVGVGPGDPDLLTLKSFNVLQTSSLIFYPTGGKETLALSIVGKSLSLKGKKLVKLYFPMKRDEALKSHWENLSETILNYLQSEKFGAFITLGDPAFYSTFFYLYPYLKKRGVEVEIIPGISSFSALSSSLAIPLALSQEEVLLTNADIFVKNFEKYVNINTIILMKCHRYLEEIKGFAEKYNFIGFIGKRIGQKRENLWRGFKEVRAEDLDYFTIITLQRRRDL